LRETFEVTRDVKEVINLENNVSTNILFI